jgi:hypothetical protein
MGLFGPPSKEKFAHLLAKAIRQAGETTTLEYDAEQASLKTASGPSNVLYLNNAYAEYCAAPRSNRPAILQRFVRVWFSYRKDTPDAFVDARPDLLPSIRIRVELHLLPLRLRTEGKGDISWPHRRGPTRDPRGAAAVRGAGRTRCGRAKVPRGIRIQEDRSRQALVGSAKGVADGTAVDAAQHTVLDSSCHC